MCGSRNFNNYENINGGDDARTKLYTFDPHIQLGSDEAGDFWEGYGEGYQQGRNGISLGKHHNAIREGLKLGYEKDE